MTNQIIGICGINGAGKTTLAKELSKVLNATLLIWDDYDNMINKPQNNDFEAYELNWDYDSWKYTLLQETLKSLQSGNKTQCPATKRELLPTNYIVFETPLGYNHNLTGILIDFLIFIDTPLDVALIRRMKRDYINELSINFSKFMEDLDYYLDTLRVNYLSFIEKQKEECDLILDGHTPVSEQISLVLSQKIFINN